MHVPGASFIKYIVTMVRNKCGRPVGGADVLKYIALEFKMNCEMHLGTFFVHTDVL